MEAVWWRGFFVPARMQPCRLGLLAEPTISPGLNDFIQAIWMRQQFAARRKEIRPACDIAETDCGERRRPAPFPTAKEGSAARSSRQPRKGAAMIPDLRRAWPARATPYGLRR